MLRSVSSERGQLPSRGFRTTDPTLWPLLRQCCRAYKEHYHTPAGARLEAEEKYIVPGKLKERLSSGDVQLLDVCFGLGYNSLAAMELAGGSVSSRSADDEDVVPPKLTITALEMDRRVVGAAAINIQPMDTDSVDWKKTISELYQFGESRLTAHGSIVTIYFSSHFGAWPFPDFWYSPEVLSSC